MIGIAATLLLAAGAMLWLTGVKTGRVLAGLVAGIAAGTLGYYKFGGLFQLSPALAGLSAGVIGFALGMLMFRISQAAVIAVAFAIVAAGSYYYVNVLPTHATPAAASVATADLSANAALAGAPTEFVGALKFFEAIPAMDRYKMLLLAAGAAILSFAIAFAFPKPTTLLASAVGGAALMLACAELLLEIYGTSLPAHLPQDAQTKLIFWGVFAAIGLIVQWRIMHRQADKSSETTRQAGRQGNACPA